METLTPRFVQTAEALDVLRPGWHREVDLGSLNMASGGRCILGQLDGHYSASVFGSHRLGVRLENITGLNMPEMGFTAWDWAEPGISSELYYGWRTEILNRLHEDALIEDMTRDAQKAKANLAKVDTDTPEPALV